PDQFLTRHPPARILRKTVCSEGGRSMPRIAGTATGSKLARVICLLALMAPFLLTSVAAHGASTFQVGDVFVGVGNGQIQWYHPDGTLVQTLNNGVGGFTTGMAFDSAGHLYGTNFSGGEKAGTPAHPNPPQGGGGSV